MPKKISIVVNGRFHAFDYAAELQKRGMLHKLISSMPFSVAKRFGIDRKNYVGMPYFEVLKVIYRRLLKKDPPAVWYSEMFTKAALRHIPSDSDIIICVIGGYSLEILKDKRLAKCIKIIDRVATHTLANLDLKKQSMEYHGFEWIQYPPQEFVKRELEEYALSDKILVPSSFVQKTFLDHKVAPEKLVKIPYTFSSKKFKINADEIIKKKKTVLFVGQVGARKGIGVLIDAMKIVREKYSEFTLTVVGSINRGINHQLLNHEWICYKGVLGGTELQNTYAEATVFCLPSFEEGLAYVLTEANHIGLPIVATPNSGVEDIKENKNKHFLSRAGDPVHLAEKIIEAIQWSQDVDNLAPTKGSSNETDSVMTWGIYCDRLLENI